MDRHHSIERLDELPERFGVEVVARVLMDLAKRVGGRLAIAATGEAVSRVDRGEKTDGEVARRVQRVEKTPFRCQPSKVAVLKTWRTWY